MLKKLNIEAFSNDDRNIVIDNIKHSIMQHDASIIHFNLFSDLAISFSIEVEEHKIIPLYEALNSILTISGSMPKNINLESKKEWLILMNVSFSKGKGRLKQNIPEVPG